VLASPTHPAAPVSRSAPLPVSRSAPLPVSRSPPPAGRPPAGPPRRAASGWGPGPARVTLAPLARLRLDSS
jgi:hypothetical protein